jgi:hypothetical protein
MAKRQNAYAQILQEKQRAATGDESQEQQQDTGTPQNTVKQQNGKTVENRKTVKSGNTTKITIYPTQEQVSKLYDLMEMYRKRTGFKINQQDMIRRLIDLADIDAVLP